jgi:phospholipid/cholesterol/gamma-HCH transport system substrate-binding protein
MSAARTTEIKVGLFTLVGIAILVGGIMWGKQKSLASGMETYKIQFPTSGGLLNGDAVTVNGVKKGHVASVNVDGNAVLVEVVLERDVQLKRDATATILMLELMGGRKVELRAGMDPTPLDPSTVIRGTTAEDIPGVVAMLGTLSGDLTRVLFRLDTLLANANSLLSDKEFITSIRESVVALDATAQSLRRFMTNNEGDMETIVSNVKVLVSDLKEFFTANKPELEKLLKKGHTTLEGVDRTLANADSTLASANTILTDIKKGNGAAHKLIYDQELGMRLDSTITNVNKVLNFILDHGVNVNLRLGTRP